MRTTTDDNGDITTLHLRGRLTADRFDERLPDIIRRMVGQDARVFVLDLREVSYMDSTCIGELVSGLLTVRKSGGTLLLASPTPRIERLLMVAGLTSVFQTFRSEQEAVLSLQES